MDSRNARLMTVKDAKASLGIGVTTLYKLMATGRISAVKLGGRTLISEAEIVRFKSELPAAELRGNYEHKAA